MGGVPGLLPAAAAALPGTMRGSASSASCSRISFPCGSKQTRRGMSKVRGDWHHMERQHWGDSTWQMFQLQPLIV
jgi:hypothetical protein